MQLLSGLFKKKMNEMTQDPKDMLCVLFHMKF